MPRSFDMATEYDGSVEQVYQTFSDEQYWLARLAHSGADDATLDLLEVAGPDRPTDSIRIKTTQVLRADRLPDLIQQFHRGDLSVQREEDWSPICNGQASGTISGAIPGAPASLTGTMVLAPVKSGSGSQHRFKIAVEVGIPLVGGKIENFIGNGLMDLLIAEQRFTTAWITENA